MANDRNAGRKPIKDSVRLQIRVPKKHLKTVKEFIKKLQYE